MFNKSVILCADMHHFNNVVLAHAVTAVLIILTGVLFLSRFAKKIIKKLSND